MSSRLRAMLGFSDAPDYRKARILAALPAAPPEAS
jgi:hypothetical protein